MGRLGAFLQRLPIPDRALARIRRQLEILCQLQRVHRAGVLAQPAEHAPAQVVGEVGHEDVRLIEPGQRALCPWIADVLRAVTPEQMRAIRDMETGITYINAPTIGAEAHLPFGGVKQTGNGHREGGWEVYDFYSETKVGYVDFSGRLQRAQIDNY